MRTYSGDQPHRTADDGWRNGHYHCNATSQTDKDQPFSQTFFVRKECPSKSELQVQSVKGSRKKPRSVVAFMQGKRWQNRDQCLTYHEQRCHNPVENNTESNLDPYLTMRKNEVKRLILDLAQNRIHHDQEANSFCRVSTKIILRSGRRFIPIGTDT